MTHLTSSVMTDLLALISIGGYLGFASKSNCIEWYLLMGVTFWFNFSLARRYSSSSFFLSAICLASFVAILKLLENEMNVRLGWMLNCYCRPYSDNDTPRESGKTWRDAENTNILCLTWSASELHNIHSWPAWTRDLYENVSCVLRPALPSLNAENIRVLSNRVKWTGLSTCGKFKEMCSCQFDICWTVKIWIPLEKDH